MPIVIKVKRLNAKETKLEKLNVQLAEKEKKLKTARNMTKTLLASIELTLEAQEQDEDKNTIKTLTQQKKLCWNEKPKPASPEPNVNVIEGSGLKSNDSESEDADAEGNNSQVGKIDDPQEVSNNGEDETKSVEIEDRMSFDEDEEPKVRFNLP